MMKRRILAVVAVAACSRPASNWKHLPVAEAPIDAGTSTATTDAGYDRAVLESGFFCTRYDGPGWTANPHGVCLRSQDGCEYYRANMESGGWAHRPCEFAARAACFWSLRKVTGEMQQSCGRNFEECGKIRTERMTHPADFSDFTECAATD